MSEEDARYKKVFLTEKGETVCEKMKRNGSHTGSRLLKGMTEEERKAFCAMIDLALKNTGVT